MGLLLTFDSFNLPYVATLGFGNVTGDGFNPPVFTPKGVVTAKPPARFYSGVINPGPGLSVNDVQVAKAVATYTTTDISPQNPTRFPNQTLQFFATRPVTWRSSLNHIAAGGLYTAPASITTNMQDLITACPTDSTISLDCATTTVFLQPIVVSVSPGQQAVLPGLTQQFTAQVNGDNPAVTWTVDVGTISSGGLFTAPGNEQILTPTTATGKASAVADPSRCGTGLALLDHVAVTVQGPTSI